MKTTHILQRTTLSLCALATAVPGLGDQTLAQAAAPAAKQQPPNSPTLRWSNSLGMEFVPIPAGTFTMGSDARDADADEKPCHRVTLSQSFYLAVTEVTQAQWKDVMGGNPSRFQGDDLPVDQVSWNEAKAFIRKLNAREGTSRYRLPTEAEWEYASRAGTSEDRHGDLSAFGWFDPNSEGRTHPVGQKQPNAWGLHDMLGNVYEWCEDWKGAYPRGHVTDPRGPRQGSARVARGGSWFVHANRTRSFFRDAFNPKHHFADMGFRIAAEVRNHR